MPKQCGLDMYLYRNTNTYASPTWVIVENVRDLTGPDSFAEADVSRRQTGGTPIKQSEPTLREFSIEFDMVYDLTDTDFAALQTAFAARTLVEIALADGAIATTGTRYFGLEMKIFEFSRNESLTDANIYHVVMKPCYSNNAIRTVTV